MVVKLSSADLAGIRAEPVTVEVDISDGLSTFNIVGMPDTAIKESRDRIRSAIKNSGFTFPGRRVTVNLAPADIRKESSRVDLPIALGILSGSSRALPRNTLKGHLFVGELSLDGMARPVTGVLSIAMLAREHDLTLVVPEHNYAEAASVDGLSILPYRSLNQLTAVLTGREEPEIPDIVSERSTPDYPVLMEDVHGQEHAKRAMIIAAAGNHNILMYGPPGSGKSMLAKALPSVLPGMTADEQIETTMIHSAGGVLDHRGILSIRPFRAPHHTISHIGLIGGGTRLNPGEVSFAHNGVLFLDEFPEFPRRTLEVLRQPMEDGHVRISRASGSVTFPSRFLMVAAMNPCPCGFFGSKERECRCTPTRISTYRGRLSGPLLDRIDLLVHVPQIPLEQMVEKGRSQTSGDIRQQVDDARQMQQNRTGCPNAYIPEARLKGACSMTGEAETLLLKAARNMKLSSRSFNRIMKVARTIADLSGNADAMEPVHIAEALQYKLSDFFSTDITYD